MTVLGGTERIIAAMHAMQVKAMAEFTRLSPPTARRADVFVNLLLGRRDLGVTGEPGGCGRWSM